MLNIKYTSIILYNFLGQLWKVDATGNVLKSKDIDWKPTDLTISGNTIATIKNGTMTLDVINTEGTLLKIEAVADLDSSQEWKKTNYANGFFTLTNKMDAKVLKAVAPNGLDIIGMCICIRNLSCLVFLKKTIVGQG